MYRLVASAASLSPGESLLDLYCGTGTFALTTAKAVPGAKVSGRIRSDRCKTEGRKVVVVLRNAWQCLMNKFRGTV